MFFQAPPTDLENPSELRLTPSEPEWFSPVIVTPPQNVTAELGVNVTLTCAAKGHPKPTIRYFELNRDFLDSACIAQVPLCSMVTELCDQVLALIHSKPA